MARLEFALDPADLPRLARWPGLRAGRSFTVDLTWQDTADGALEDQGLALCVYPTGATLSEFDAAASASPPTVLAEARRSALLGRRLPDDMVVVARLRGQRRTLRPETPGGVEIRVLDSPGAGPGQLQACRVTLDGPAPLLTPMAVAIAQDLRLRVPRASLARQVLAGARGHTLPPRTLGAPQVSAGLTVTDSLAAIAGHLLDVMLHWGELAPTARTPEPVHQMRVATRRLRSALSIYRKVASCPGLNALAAPLKLCAARLGKARDWDVFIDGTGARLADTFPGDKRCAAMMRAAGRRRRDAYAELRIFLEGPDFRTLTASVACAVALRPWDDTAPAETMQQDTAVFAAAVLTKRMRRVKTDGQGIADLPIPALHELRKDCKRLRYAAEFFSTLVPQKRVKRFLNRLADLQEELGLLNDTAAVSGLMAQLGRMERSYAAGLVEGFSAANAGTARARIVAAWKRFRLARPFWIG